MALLGVFSVRMKKLKAPLLEGMQHTGAIKVSRRLAPRSG
jgi:hypothetical protein